MKKILIASVLLSTFVIVFNGCRKDDNPKIPGLERFSWLPLLVKDATANPSISPSDPENFVGRFTVDEYFESGDNPQKVDVVVIKNGNKGNIKTIKTDITTFPATVEVTGTQLTSLFGGTIVLGDLFQIGVDITSAGGKKFEAFPATGNAYASGIVAQPGASPTITYLAACTFDKNSFNGNYKVVQDDWADFKVGELIAVAPGAGVNQIAITAFPSPAFGSNRKPMIIDVDPATFGVTVPEQVIGDYDGAPPGATVRGEGTLNPCGDEITLTVTIKIGVTDYTGQVFKITK